MAKERASENTFFRKVMRSASREEDVDKSWDERRKYKRFKIDDYSLHCHRKGILSAIGLKKKIQGSIFDISGGGVRIVTNEAIPVDSKITVKVNLHRFSDSVETTGRVLWLRNVPGQESRDKLYHIGVEFDNPEDKEAKKIDYMRNWFLSPQAQAKMEKKSKTTIFTKLMNPKK